MNCGNVHPVRLTLAEQEAFNRAFNEVLDALKLDDGTVPGWSTVRVTGALHAMFIGAFSYHAHRCEACDEALEALERGYMEKAVEIEREKDVKNRAGGAEGITPYMKTIGSA